MADPICRWRNPYIETVLELISFLPKNELHKSEARNIINKRFNGNFFHTAYQTASQVGLYYEKNDYFFPKFTYDPTIEEIKTYMSNWIKQYSIPNPYTRGFNHRNPFSIHKRLCEILIHTRKEINFLDIALDFFGEEIGNIDILTNAIDKYSDVIQFKKGIVKLKENVEYSDLVSCLDIDVNQDRSNKEYFFDSFILPNNNFFTNFELNNSEVEQLKKINNSNTLTKTEKYQLVKSRIGQGKFRRNLIVDCQYCPITRVNDVNLLIASHIKPWRVSNNHERVDEKNGLLLTPTFDKLFDKGYISFHQNKDMIVSTTLTQTNCKSLKIYNGLNIPHLQITGREEYLNYHRALVLK